MVEPGVHQWDAEASVARERLEAEGWRVFELPRGITNKAAFIRGLRDSLPLDPPLHGCDNWDAASDSLWGGLDSLPEQRVAIIWAGSRFMATHAREEWAIAQDILIDVASSLADVEATGGEPTHLHVALV